MTHSHHLASFRARRGLAAAALFALAACESSSANPQRPTAVVDTLPSGAVRTISVSPMDSGRWTLELLHEIQPAEGATGELMRPYDVATTDDGLVLVADEGTGSVTVFDASGAFLRTIGRNGSGPGEFRYGWIAARGDTLYVQDPQGARGSVFRISTGELMSLSPTGCCYWNPIAIDGEGRAVVAIVHTEADTSAGPAVWFVRAPLTGAAADTVRVGHRRPSGGTGRWDVSDGTRRIGSVTVPLAPREVQKVEPAGGFLTAWTGEYVLRASRDGSDSVALFGRAFTSVRVTAAEKQLLVEETIQSMRRNDMLPEAAMRAAFVPSAIPDQRPALDGFHSDAAGRTWVRRSQPDTSVVEFDLFGADRRWLDVVRVPGALWPSSAWASVAWSTDRAVTMAEDDDGRPLLRVFRIVRRG